MSRSFTKLRESTLSHALPYARFMDKRRNEHTPQWRALAVLVAVATIGALGAFPTLRKDADPNRDGSGQQDRAGGSAEHTLVVNKTIPLESIYGTSTFGCSELHQVERQPDEPYSEDIEALLDVCSRMGASNIFLVRADDLASAIKATRTVFTRCKSIDCPVDADIGAESKEYWLVVYFGTRGSEPLPWLLHGVELSQGRLSVKYTKPKRVGASADIHQHFVWVPLGTLTESEYSLELFDASRNVVTLMRRVGLRAAQ